MSKLWTHTVETHRQEVHEAIFGAVGQLVGTQGVLAVTMSRVAETAGIGRATLYKYFPDVEQLLETWHERHVTAHLATLAAIATSDDDPAQRLRAALSAYAQICAQRSAHTADRLGAALHRSDSVRQRHQELVDLVTSLVVEAAAAGEVRDDVPAGALASFCLHALEAAGDPPSGGDQVPLVNVVWSALAAMPQPSGVQE